LIIIFGAGGRGVEVAREALLFGMKIIFFVDNNKGGTNIGGIDVVKPDDPKLSALKNIPVFIATNAEYNNAEIKTQLESLGFTKFALSYDERRKYYPEQFESVGGGGEMLENVGAGMTFTTIIGCPIGCRFCPQKLFVTEYKKRDKDIPLKLTVEKFKEYLHKIPLSVEISFSGFSEPLLNENCPEMIKYAYDNGYTVNLYSTLVGLKYESVSLLKNIKFKHVCIHLPDSNDYCNIKITDEYKKTLEKFLRYIDTHKFELMTHGDDIHNDIKSIVNNSQYPYAYPYKLDKVMVDWAGNVKDDILSETTFKKGSVFCSAHVRTVNRNYILPDGSVLICCADFGMKHILGNLNNMSYIELFESEEAKRINRAFDDDSMELICRTCSRVCGV
jgi:organic radical activating enzyme